MAHSITNTMVDLTVDKPEAFEGDTVTITAGMSIRVYVHKTGDTSTVVMGTTSIARYASVQFTMPAFDVTVSYAAQGPSKD